MLVVACGDPTEIFVVVDSDMRVPAELDAVTVRATSPTGELQSANGTIADAPLPRTLGLVHESGPPGPFVVHVQGTRGGSLVVERRARLSFIEGRVLVLPIHLLGRCAGMVCGADTTCGESGGCVSIDVDESALAEWNGTVPRLDGGSAPDTTPPMCTPSAESCNDRDDDCDTMVDETFDLTSDVDNCGACGNRCRGGNAMCCAGVCGRGACP